MSRLKVQEHVNRRRVYQSLDEIQSWCKQVEKDLKTDPDGVIAYLQLQSIQQAVFELVNTAGHVNACVLVRDAQATGNITSSKDELAGLKGQDVYEAHPFTY